MVLSILFLPPIFSVIPDLARKPPGVSAGQHLAASASAAVDSSLHPALALSFLPYEATVNLDAIVRSAWRMLVTRRHLLGSNASVADEPGCRERVDIAGRHGLALSVREM